MISDGFSFKQITVEIFEPSNVLQPFSIVTLLPIVTEVRFVQSLKVSYPKEVTLLGITTEVKLLQL